MLCFAENRFHNDPFDLYFCNANMNGAVMKQLQRNIPTMREPWFPLNVHTESYLDIFPKENLVYLTPHCRNDLMEYNPDDVYIVGAMVDKINNEPLSLAKAKRQGLRMARLPLDHYLSWGSGSGKSLTLNQMINIMLDIKTTGSWEQALQHVPRRKIVHPHEQVAIDQQKSRWDRKNHKRMDELKFDLKNWGNSQKSRPRSVTDDLLRSDKRKPKGSRVPKMGELFENGK
jgi:mitochondrial ribonuclease P protein 1